MSPGNVNKSIKGEEHYEKDLVYSLRPQAADAGFAVKPNQICSAQESKRYTGFSIARLKTE